MTPLDSAATPPAPRDLLAEHFHGQWCNSTHHRSPQCRSDVQPGGLDYGKADALLASPALDAIVAERVAALAEDEDRRAVATWLIREADRRVKFFPQRRDGVDALLRALAAALTDRRPTDD